MPAPEERLDRPAFRRELVFAGLAVSSILVGLARFADPAPAPWWLQAADVAIATAFAGDWLWRVSRSNERGRYALWHAYEVVTFIPFTLIPDASGADVLRGARLLRFARLLRYGAFAKLGLGVWRLPRRLRRVGRIVRHAQLVTLGAAGVVIVGAGGALLLAFERGRTVLDYGDALWWALSMFSTVAYDVPSPATPGGRAVTALLMVSGLLFVGVFTASLASAILREPDADAADEA